MTDDSRNNMTPDMVLERVRAEIARSGRDGGGSFRLEAIGRLRSMQRDFRVEPIGGRLVWLKKMAFWFVASAFDRQSKVIEALLDVVEDLSDEVERMPAELGQEPTGRPSNLQGQSGNDESGEGWEAPDQVASFRQVLDVDAEMLIPERALLYSLVLALKPKRCLEIGTLRGGSASIMCRAMDDNGLGRLICVDPEPRIPDEVWTEITHRATLIVGASPGALQEARDSIGESFDFVLIDGDHSFRGALDDIEGALEHTRDGGYIVLHDCHFYDVRDAIDEALRRHPERLVDCGVVSVTENPQEGEHAFVDGRRVVWGGLRLLRGFKSRS
jgi:predicted O-methyltransferase YrrM